MKKFSPYILILIILATLFSSSVRVEAIKIPCTAPGIPRGCTDYYLLAPLPDPSGGTMSKFDPTTGLSGYLNLMITIFIGICAVLAVIMIVIGGIEYMTSELVSSKAAGIERIKNAILGLLLALGAWIILYTINPKILDTDLKSLKEQIIGVTLVELSGGSYSSSGGVGSGMSTSNCSTIQNPTNACSVDNLKKSCFSDRAEEASRICNIESGGGLSPDQESSSDKLNSGAGPSYSIGLWQINLTAHKVAGLDCPTAFSKICGKGTATPNKRGPFDGGPKVGNCSSTIKPDKEPLYDACVAAAKIITNNIGAACNASKENGGGFKPWAYTANKCSIPF